MTSLLTLEAAEAENRIVTITPEMIRVEGSSMGLRAGDRLTLRDLAAGMLMVSGNDAANSAALSVGGTMEKFASMMNAKAAGLGMKDTHFVTPVRVGRQCALFHCLRPCPADLRGASQ